MWFPVLPGIAMAATPEPVVRCAMQDSRLTELSGLAADGERLYAVNDGGTSIEIFVLGPDCVVHDVITSDIDPYDVEDLARAPDGTLWLADTGDNRKQRNTVALHAVSPDGTATLHRLTYPDGPHDTEALLLGRDSRPYLVTKTPLGTAGVYRPSGPLASPGPTPLDKVGSVSVSSTDTPGGPVAGMVGSVLLTGGTVSADGRVVALRTYTDAYLYPAPDGDIAAALGREPRRVPLPDEAQGEAIAFEPDGTLLSASEGTREHLRAVEGAAGLVPLPEPRRPADSAPSRDDGTGREGGGQDGSGRSSAGRDGSGQDGSGQDGARRNDIGQATDAQGLSTWPAVGIGVVIAVLIAMTVGWLRRRTR
ncbi:MAG: hypothetical protein GEU98_12100 [Pseudonocardiaceae bacterium]|nr:hypothetical protein [Pseudonocardiaceae bacterium]